MAFSLTPSKLKEMWIIPLGYVVTTADDADVYADAAANSFVLITGASAGVAWFLSKVFKLKRSQT